jgi:hypothetical protein
METEDGAEGEQTFVSHVPVPSQQEVNYYSHIPYYTHAILYPCHIIPMPYYTHAIL